MQFVLTESSRVGSEAIAKRLEASLASGQKVLWLVCGGSNIASEAEIMAALPAELTSRLTVTLTDERYGPVDHKDSNSKQLADAGFDVKNGKFVPVLQPDMSLEYTRQNYASIAKTEIEQADEVIAQFGIGPDGHIAGILPQSPAAASEDWAAGYDAPPFTRLTLTFNAIHHINAAYAMAFGDSKQEALAKLQNQELALAVEPSQILKQLPEAYVYNDQLGD